MNEDSKKAGGVFYTPPDIAGDMVRHALAATKPGRPLRILDPACGDGAFLAAAHRHAPTARLYGVDIDPLAVAAARSATPGSSIKCGNALMGFDWVAEFPEVFTGDDPGFDMVIGNPPWVSLSGKFGAEGYTREEIDYLTRRYQGNTYMPNLFEYFTALGLELTRRGGCFSFIVPDRLGFNGQFAGLRQRMLAETTLLSVRYRVPFPGVTADTLIFLVRKDPPPAGAQSPNLFHVDHPLVAKIEALPHVRPLGDLCNTTSGFGGKSRLISPEQGSPAQIPVLKGESIGRYRTGRSFWFEFARENLTGRTLDPAKLGAVPKVLLRKTGDRIVATYDESGLYPEQSLYFLYNKWTDMDFRFMLG
ncbi:MAG TPA: N-6 DNA methylase, partial [Symbiobacteriaceae bacterium]|nr:N-6 DNA methylase [Symbiobacteriaceae bacterium]